MEGNGAEFKIKDVGLDDKTFKLQIWEISGTERYRRLIRGAEAILVVYDSSDRASFVSVPAWMRAIQTFAREDVTRLIVANKLDVEQPAVCLEEGQALAQSLGVPLIGCSARTCSNVDHVFEEATRAVHSRVVPRPVVVTVFASGTGPDDEVDLTCFGISGEEMGACRLPITTACTDSLPRLRGACEIRVDQVATFITPAGQDISDQCRTEYEQDRAEVTVVLEGKEASRSIYEAAILARGLHPDDVEVRSCVGTDSTGKLVAQQGCMEDASYPVTIRFQVKRRKKPATIADAFKL